MECWSNPGRGDGGRDGREEEVRPEPNQRQPREATEGAQGSKSRNSLRTSR